MVNLPKLRILFLHPLVTYLRTNISIHNKGYPVIYMKPGSRRSPEACMI